MDDQSPMLAPGQSVQLLPISLIDADPANIRRTPPSPLEDATFRASLEAQGQLQPVVVRETADARYRLIFGARRVNAARELGWATVNAIVSNADDTHAKAMQAAENAHRLQMHPLDTWQAMVSLQAAGLSLEASGQCLGLTDRRARQLDRLGRISDVLLDAMRKHGLPNDRDLAAIAEAAPDVQARVFKKVLKGSGGHLQWWQVARDLQEHTISQSAAVFDVEKATDIAWQEDVFAEPTGRARFTTTNLRAFMKHQVKAITEQVAARQKKKEAVELVEFDGDSREPLVPEGYGYCYDAIPKSMKLKEGDPRKLLIAVATNGEIKQLLVIEKGKKSPKLAELARKNREAAQIAAADDAERGDGTPAPAVPARTMTASGIAMVSAAQTAAIQARLRKDGGIMQAMDLLKLLCIAVCGDNVKVASSTYGTIDLADVLHQLVTQEGVVIASVEKLKEIAAEIIARMVVVATPKVFSGSGSVAMSIGHHIAAGDCLEPFDSPEFLATLSGSSLKAAAEAVGITDTKKAGVLRERLTGKIGKRWAPAEADFEPLPPRQARQAPTPGDGWDDDGEPYPEGGGNSVEEEA